MMYSQMPGNLFPSHKLKGNHTVTTQAVAVRNDKAKEDQGMKPEGKREMELSVDVV